MRIFPEKKFTLAGKGAGDWEPEGPSPARLLFSQSSGHQQCSQNLFPKQSSESQSAAFSLVVLRPECGKLTAVVQWLFAQDRNRVQKLVSLFATNDRICPVMWRRAADLQPVTPAELLSFSVPVICDVLAKPSSYTGMSYFNWLLNSNHDNWLFSIPLSCVLSCPSFLFGLFKLCASFNLIFYPPPQKWTDFPELTQGPQFFSNLPQAPYFCTLMKSKSR